MKKNNYLIQLDGVRAIAILLVLVDHWFTEYLKVPLGILGVTMFFVLSGFLITRILITSKLNNIETKTNPWITVKQFFIRRSLRIFPIYFLSIFILFWLDVPPVRDTILWCLTYSTNLYIALNETWLGTIDHLWSLAVEEQYYLFFPYLILFLPIKNYKTVLIAMIVIAITLRIVLFLNGNDWMAQYVLMPTCLDSFGLGGLLAYWYVFKRNEVFTKIAWPVWILISFLIMLVFMGISRYVQVETSSNHHFGNLVFERLIYSVFCFFFIAGAISEYGGALKQILENKVTLFIGKISYGLYLYHNFVYNHYHTPDSSIVVRVLKKVQGYGYSMTHSLFFEVIYYFTITLLLATASWFLIEKPINGLKKYFNYH